MDEINAVRLVHSKGQSLDLNKCVICQKRKKNEKLRSTPHGRNVVVQSFEHLGETILSNYSTEVLETIQYHDSCFGTYKIRAERYKPNPSDDSAECTNSNIEEVSVDIIKSPITRSQSGSSKSCKSDDAVHICVICNCYK